MPADAPNILLLAGNDLAASLSQLSPRCQFVHRADPYEALEELSRHPFQSVIVENSCPDLAGLVRAMRCIRKSVVVYGLCSPAAEAQLRTSGMAGLDDYFIYPPSVEELERICRPARAVTVPRGVSDVAADLPMGEINELIEATGSLEALAEHLRRRVAEWSGMEVAWHDAVSADRPGQPLLLLDGDAPRVLVGDETAELSPALLKKLHLVQALLPGLAIVAKRTQGLHHLAITDHLTGAYNRRYFYHFTDQLLTRAKSERFRATLLLFDIDDFKRYNDAYGHAAGDEILRDIAGLIKQVTRKHDIVARIGGDEFAALFWDAEPPRRPDSAHPTQATFLAGRFLHALERHEFPSLGADAKGVLTISGGLATFPWDGATCRELLRHADGSLRQAKTSGKNAIYLIGQTGRGQAIDRDGAEPRDADDAGFPAPPSPRTQR